MTICGKIRKSAGTVGRILPNLRGYFVPFEPLLVVVTTPLWIAKYGTLFIKQRLAAFGNCLGAFRLPLVTTAQCCTKQAGSWWRLVLFHLCTVVPHPFGHRPAVASLPTSCWIDQTFHFWTWINSHKIIKMCYNLPITFNYVKMGRILWLNTRYTIVHMI